MRIHISFIQLKNTFDSLKEEQMRVIHPYSTLQKDEVCALSSQKTDFNYFEKEILERKKKCQMSASMVVDQKMLRYPKTIVFLVKCQK